MPPVKKPSDEDLMAQFAAGDAKAFEELAERHRRGIYAFILRFVGHRNTADDLLQDVFVRIVRSADGFERRSRFTTWAYTIARNLCIDHLRKQKHRRHQSLDQPLRKGENEGLSLMDRVATKDAGPDRGAENARLRTLLAEAVAALNEEQREVFLMREQAGLPFDAIAGVVGAPVNTVKSRMRYALQNLRARLEAAGMGLER
ncbi:MAG: RNA polymerase sigma factor [Deltaproteobacteria bacterium]|nr:RNA polymerase sigma factor [Deltaproteobacteria bacterium]